MTKKAVALTGGRDRRLNMPTTPADKTESNLDKRVTDFFALIGKKVYYRSPLGFFTSLGLVNFPHKIDTHNFCSHYKTTWTDYLKPMLRLTYQTNLTYRLYFMICHTSLIHK